VYIGGRARRRKTYLMLRTPHLLRRSAAGRGRGVCRDYGRADTEAQIGQLEVILDGASRTAGRDGRDGPRRGTDAPPAVAIVDELAHTNVPGSRHAKRFEDVIELLDAAFT